MRKLPVVCLISASMVGGLAVTRLHAEDRQERREERKEEAGWVKLGERKVDFKTEKDTIDVGRSEGKFNKLRLRVVDGDVELYKMKIIFEHGDPLEPEMRHHFKEGDRTHDIDLPGEARTVKKVEFYYKSEHHSPAVVELIGKEAR